MKQLELNLRQDVAADVSLEVVRSDQSRPVVARPLSQFLELQSESLGFGTDGAIVVPVVSYRPCPGEEQTVAHPPGLSLGADVEERGAEDKDVE